MPSQSVPSARSIRRAERMLIKDLRFALRDNLDRRSNGTKLAGGLRTGDETSEIRRAKRDVSRNAYALAKAGGRFTMPFYLRYQWRRVLYATVPNWMARPFAAGRRPQFDGGGEMPGAEQQQGRGGQLHGKQLERVNSAAAAASFLIRRTPGLEDRLDADTTMRRTRELLTAAATGQSQVPEYRPEPQATGYQPTGYQPTGYQPTSYQPTSYQPTSSNDLADLYLRNQAEARNRPRIDYDDSPMARVGLDREKYPWVVPGVELSPQQAEHLRSQAVTPVMTAEPQYPRVPIPNSYATNQFSTGSSVPTSTHAQSTSESQQHQPSDAYRPPSANTHSAVRK